MSYRRMDDWLQCVDQRLYEAKRWGRNRVAQEAWALEIKKGANMAPFFAEMVDQPVLRMPAAMPAMVTINA